MKINKPRVAIFSDLHLGVHSNSSEWHNYAVEWAHWFKEECKRKNIKDLIITKFVNLHISIEQLQKELQLIQPN